IRDDPESFDAGLARRGLPPQAQAILALDQQRRTLQTDIQEAQSARNRHSKDIGAAMKAGNKALAEELKRKVEEVKSTIQSAEGEEAACAGSLETLLLSLPNLPADDVPVGADETANVERRKVGAPPRLDFAARTHDALGGADMDFERAARLS